MADVATALWAVRTRATGTWLQMRTTQRRGCNSPVASYPPNAMVFNEISEDWPLFSTRSLALGRVDAVSRP